jgi:chromosome segregation protein
LTNDLALFVHEIEVLAMDRTGFRQKWESHAQVIRGLEEEEMAFRSRAEAEEKEFALQREKASRETTARLELRGSIDVLQEKIANLEVVLKTLGQRKDNAAAKIDALQAEIGAAEAEETRLKDLDVELRERLSAQEDQRGRQGSALVDNEVHLQRIRNELAAAETGLAVLREDHERKKDERMTWEIRKAEIDRDLVNLEETCWQELKKTLQEVKAELPPPETEAGDVEAALEEAKEKLLKYGAVNLMAEEEYAAQKERYDFLTQQKKDLTESIAQTKEAILKIDDESRQRFLTALGEVNTHFQDLFATLFKGGTAEVKLLDEANPLESGVDVIAQPPGKKVQNMGLLSGGEKSLTSLAFLFALFRYKPTPFCILDEVDAALDEVNLARFLDLMRTIKAETQFIIITHNYKTMEVADYIYGTTMEEPNVTKVFSMKLEKKGESGAVD